MKTNKKNIDSIDALLEGIQKVETPPFLLTRIQAQLNSQKESIPIKWVCAAVATFVLLFMANLWTIQQNVSDNHDTSIVLEEMMLLPDNSFYH